MATQSFVDPEPEPPFPKIATDYLQHRCHFFNCNKSLSKCETYYQRLLRPCALLLSVNDDLVVAGHPLDYFILIIIVL